MAPYDFLIAPAAKGEAPAGLHATGDPIFSRLWTLLRVPAVSLPAGAGPHGLPLGIQLIGRMRNDDTTLGWAQWVENVLRP